MGEKQFWRRKNSKREKKIRLKLYTLKKDEKKNILEEGNTLTSLPIRIRPHSAFLTIATDPPPSAPNFSSSLQLHR
jgi:hypothetical protein